jgi:hypothetical protein
VEEECIQPICGGHDITSSYFTRCQGSTVGGATVQGFIQWDGGIYPWHEFDISPINLSFVVLFSGFENVITSNVIFRHLELELSILRCLKLIRGIISTLKKKNFSPFLVPHTFFPGGNSTVHNLDTELWV